MDSIKRLLADYLSLLQQVDGWFTASSRALGPERVRCSTGCSACCSGLFDIGLLDARLLQEGFTQLLPTIRSRVLERARPRLTELRIRWPDFTAPFLLNHLPDEEWTEMPEGDQTPCPLLDDEGRCLVYAFRPMTCRLHGLPNIDLSGEGFSDSWCTLNFPDVNPLELPELRWRFRAIFGEEFRLKRQFAAALFGHPTAELDTFIPTALFIDFPGTDWPKWWHDRKRPGA